MTETGDTDLPLRDVPRRANHPCVLTALLLLESPDASLATSISVRSPVVPLGRPFGLFKLTLKFALVALVGLGVFKLGRRLFGSTPPRYAKPVTEQLPPADPYYESAMRELDGEFGRSR